MTRPKNNSAGFTAAELLLVLALGACVIGASVVGYGTIVRNQQRVSSSVDVELGAARMAAFYNTTGTAKTTTTAPNFGALSLAERLREEFHNDVISATAVFCLARDVPNTFHPTAISYNPASDDVLDSMDAFRKHVQTKAGISYFKNYRNHSESATNATIFILGYSKVADELKVNATWDIDLVKINRSSTSPDGIHASVKRFTNTPQPEYYDIFYPPSDTKRSWSSLPDGFTPLYCLFERRALTSVTEGSTGPDRFKKAAERPFYYIWWPDPAARDLGGNTLSSIDARDPRRVYNHQGGRTSFMFVVPMFPAL